MKTYIQLSYAGSLASLGVASCCVLPMVLIVIGVGGSWLAVFARIAAASLYVLAASTAMLALAWIVAHRRRVIARFRWWLAGSTALTALAWLVATGEARINDYVMTWM